MSLRDSTLWEVLKSAFGPKVWSLMWQPTVDTLYMVGLTSVITLLLGVLLGLVLVTTREEGLYPSKIFNRVLGAIINCLRSLPAIIMLIVMIPVARAIVGRAYGTNACIIALAASCIPMFARLVESSILEISKGKIEAAKSMGSTNIQIIWYVLLPETLPSLIRSFTVTLVAIVSMTALAGNFGAGGLGDIAVRYGFQRFQHDMLFATVFLMIIMVQAIQLIGDLLSKALLKKRHLI